MKIHRLKLRVAGDTPAEVVQRLADAVERSGALQFVTAGGGEIWDPVVVIADRDRLADLRPVLAEPRVLDGRVVVGIEGLAALPDDEYWDLRRQGAAELFDLAADRIDAELRTLAGRCTRWAAVDELLASARVVDVLVGRNPVWVRALRALVEAATGGDQPVLIHGETGTGKEAAARLVHDAGAHARGPFVVVDCAAIVESLSGSELFGHKRGAFTGAERDRDGAIQRADGGTLFLDELGELKPALQAELLRVLQEGVWRAVGDDQARRSRFRLVAATNRDLEQMVRLGTFRSDLYYRIASTTVNLPPLRARRDDIPLLLAHFLRELLRDQRPLTVDDRLLRLLQSLPFEGNVRQLRSMALTLAAQHDGSPVVGCGHVPAALLRQARHGAAWTGDDLRRVVRDAVEAGETFRSIVDTCKDAACAAALGSGGSARRAARMLAVSTRMVEKRRRPRAA